MKSLDSCLDAVQAEAKLKDIARNVWHGGRIIRGTLTPDHYEFDSSYNQSGYISYVSLAYDYPIRYVAFKLSSSQSPYQDIKHVLPAEQDKDWLSYYGRLTAHYVNGEKRTQLFIMAVERQDTHEVFLEIHDDHSRYLTGDESHKDDEVPYPKSFGSLTTTFDGIDQPIIRFTDDRQSMREFVDRWLKTLSLRRANAQRLPRELAAKARR